MTNIERFYILPTRYYQIRKPSLYRSFCHSAIQSTRMTHRSELCHHHSIHLPSICSRQFAKPYHYLRFTRFLGVNVVAVMLSLDTFRLSLSRRLYWTSRTGMSSYVLSAWIEHHDSCIRAYPRFFQRNLQNTNCDANMIAALSDPWSRANNRFGNYPNLDTQHVR